MSEKTSFLTSCFSIRSLFGLMALASAGLMLFALYLQHVVGEHPCPLCITQRIFVILAGLLALLACLHNPAALGRRIWSGLILLSALVGGGVSARHVWIQRLPEDQVPACGPGLQYMFDRFPLQKALEVLFRGDGNCHEIGWTLLTLSIPEWTFLAFTGFAVSAIWQAVRPSAAT